MKFIMSEFRRSLLKSIVKLKNLFLVLEFLNYIVPHWASAKLKKKISFSIVFSNSEFFSFYSSFG
jgi:hypothetical protein